MQKIGYLIIIIIIAALVYIKFPRKVSKTIDQKIASETFSLEVANNTYLLAKGLSNRTELCANCGMIFIFPFETTQTFWMKDTLIPLDMIFINQSGQITDIYTANPEPGKNDFQLTMYSSTSPSKYVIELNANTSKKLELKKGDLINLNI